MPHQESKKSNAIRLRLSWLRGWSSGALVLAFLFGASALAGSQSRPFVIAVPQSGDPFVLVTEDFSIVGSVSSSDFERAQKLQGTSGGEILWFSHEGKAYWIRDPEVLRQARALFAEQHALAAEQARLAALQTELGKKQTELGREQTELGKRQNNLDWRQQELGWQHTEIGRRQQELGRQQSEIGNQQDELGRRQTEIGRQQTELGRRQEELGRQGAERMQALLADALAGGKAEEAER